MSMTARTRITDEMLDAGGKALREKLQAGKRLNNWRLVPRSQKQKWLDYARVVLEAALQVATCHE